MAETKTEHHEHGTMDITQQEKTFSGFIKVTAIFFVHVLAILALLAIFRT